ncbi:MAG: DUF748 domain-containing protein [Myxococcota bacterium]
MDGSESGFLSRLVGTRRNRILLGLGALMLVARVALPFVVRPILVTRADAALVGRIELGSLDLSLLRGGVTLHDFSVHVDERPSDAPALFEADRLWTQISWLALLSRTIEIEEFEVEGFAVRLDRFEDGLLLPKPIPTAAEESAAEAGDGDAAASSWSFAADGVALRDGSVALRDHTVQGEPERFEFGIEDLSARELAIRTHPGDEEPGRIAIEAMLDEGSVSLAAWIKQQEEGLDVRATLDLAGLPIDQARAYLTMFDWNALSGRLDAQLEYRSEAGGRQELGGRAAIADLRVGVPGLADPALAWERLEVVVDRIDLAERIAEIGSIRSTGARLVVDPRAPHPVALLAPGKTESVEPAAAAEAPREAADATSDAQDASDAQSDSESEEASPPFAWRIGELILSEAVVDLRGAAEPLPLRIEAELSALSSEAGARAPIALDVATPSGSLTLDGELAPTPLAFAGKLAIHDLVLAPLFARIEAPAVHWLRDGTLRANLDLALADDLRASGRIGLAKLDLAEATTEKEFAVAWQDLELALSQLVFEDPLGPGDPAKPRALDLRLARIRLVGPNLKLTRTADGIVLPPLTPGAAATAEGAPGDPAAPIDDAAGTPAGIAAPSTPGDPPAPDESEPSTIALRIAVDALQITGGRARIADRAVEPFYSGKLDALELQAAGLRWPERRVESLDLKVEGLRGGTLAIRGSIDPDDAKLEATLVALPLDQFNPYLTTTGYALSDGALSLDSKARLRGERFTTRSKVVVQTLAIGGAEGEAAFQESFGIPLSVALGLLKDLDGKISLALPVAGERDKVDVGIGRLVGQALRKALVGALASPLKLLGAVTRDGKVERIAPAPIAYAPGTATLSAAGSERAEEVAALLATTPSLSLELKGQIASADLRVLRERALLAELESTSGLRALATLGERATRRAVQDHLARAHAGEAAPPLSSEDARWLEDAVAAQTLAPETLARLAEQRASHLRALLESEHGIAAARIALGPPAIDPPAPEPGVALALGGLAAAP